MQKLKVGDTVRVILGKDKGREGKIEKVFPAEGTVLVPGVNLYKKHVRAALTRDRKGGIFEVPKALAFSKIALICPSCKKMTRVGFSVSDGKKERVCKKCQKII